jgi:hypothetical protein
MQQYAIPPIGSIEQCPHCFGRSVCCQGNNGYLSQGSIPSCSACIKRAKLDITQAYYNIVCSVCNGKGKVWIGPRQA